MNCGSCGHENRDGAKFCEECGAPAQLACGSCGNALRAGANLSLSPPADIVACLVQRTEHAVEQCERCPTGGIDFAAPATPS